MNCECKTTVDAKLKEQNLRLCGYAIVMPDFRLVPQIKTEWVDDSKSPRGQKRNPPQMLASHCPFCGKEVK